MRIAIVGAGGVGAGFAACLADRDHDIVALARGRHLQAIRERGLVVRREGAERVLKITASDNAAELGSVDLVLFAVKLWSTEEAALQARDLMGPETAVLVLQNGVDALDILAPILGQERLLGGVAQISAVIEEPGVVAHRSPFARIIAGEPSGRMSARLDLIIDVLNEAGIEARATDQIDAELWNKFVFIVGLSGATSFFRSSIGPILADAETALFINQLVNEAVSVGLAEGVPLAPDQADRTMQFIRSLPAQMRASMFEDLLAGRRLELPWLSGRVVASGRKEGILTPANSTVELALKLHATGAVE
jgi:2-dehydropantoate 2-reductase